MPNENKQFYRRATSFPYWRPPSPLVRDGKARSFRVPQAIDVGMQWHEGPRRTALQAGCHLGIWPAKLSILFQQAIGFEPVIDQW